jgi:hypothetical protein
MEKTIMTHPIRTKTRGIPICQETDFRIFTTVSKRLASILLIAAALPITAYAAPNYPLDFAPPTTRQQTVRPIAITSPSAPELNLSDVPDFALMAGVPARRIGWMSHFGARRVQSDRAGEWQCPETNRRYRELSADVLEEIV